MFAGFLWFGKKKEPVPASPLAQIMSRRHDEEVQKAVSVLPPGSLHIAMSLVAEAANKFLNDEKRREWAVGQLKQTFPGWMARLLVELAVALLKKEAGQA